MCADADFNSRFAELPKQLRLALLAIPSAAEQRQVLALVEETLDASRAEGELQFNLEVDFSDWTEGVEAFKHLKIEEIAAALGLNAEVEGGAPNFPFFNDVIDLNNAGRPWEEREREKEEGASQGKGKGKGKATRKSGDPDADTPLYIELRPYWHQWIAAVKMTIYTGFYERSHGDTIEFRPENLRVCLDYLYEWTCQILVKSADQFLSN